MKSSPPSALAAWAKRTGPSTPNWDARSPSRSCRPSLRRTLIVYRFEQEARTTGLLNHPNILTVHDVGHADGHPYLVSELLEGETLRERLSRGPLSAERAVGLAAQVARGLAAAHAKGVIHRDLKPENLFITRDGRVKILDFGIAKLVQSQGQALDQLTTAPGTVVGAIVGTVAYMSPEQVAGRAIDQRSDLFSFGVVLYEMLTGRRPFDGNSPIETMTAVLQPTRRRFPQAVGPSRRRSPESWSAAWRKRRMSVSSRRMIWPSPSTQRSRQAISSPWRTPG